ncbi:MAG: PEPxxWA-CTERM sorting domain-containing protein [Novosphingobium sp.]
MDSAVTLIKGFVLYKFSDDLNHTDGASFVGSITVSDVPEPSTWALTLAGIAVVGCEMRRRRRVRKVGRLLRIARLGLP